MADVSEIPWRRDPSELTPRLGEWAAHAIASDAEVADVAAPDGNGMSSETVLFDIRRGASVDRYAARLAPAPSQFPVFPSYDLDMQRRCMELVAARTGVPVPRVPWYEPDPAWLGTPFLVMNRIDGRAPSDIPPYVFEGWLLEASDVERRRLQAHAIRVLAELHAITSANADLSFLARPEHGDTALDQQLGSQRAYYAWAREGESYPLIERTLDWLDAHRPLEEPAVLNWGDARIGNILFQDMIPVAVLDWEMATVGPAEVDVGWMIFLHRFFQDLAERFEFVGLPDFMVRDDVATAYEVASGRALHDLDWFEVLAALKFAIVSVRTSVRAVAHDAMEPPAEPDDVVMFRALLEQMLDGTYWD